MSRTKHALGLADACPTCSGATEITHPVQWFGPDGLELDYAYEPCPACNSTGIAGTAPAWMEAAHEEHTLITQQKEKDAWMF